MIRKMRDFSMAVALVALLAARGRAQQSSCEHCAAAKAPPALMLLAQPVQTTHVTFRPICPNRDLAARSGGADDKATTLRGCQNPSNAVFCTGI